MKFRTPELIVVTEGGARLRVPTYASSSPPGCRRCDLPLRVPVCTPSDQPPARIRRQVGAAVKGAAGIRTGAPRRRVLHSGLVTSDPHIPTPPLPPIPKHVSLPGSAQISWSSVYIAWLCSAVFYHLPSLDTLGIDLRADLSILLTTFLLSLAVLGAAAAAHAAALALAWVRPWLAHPSAASVITLHAANLALACSTYHNFCETEAGGGAESASGTGPRAALLHLFRPTGVQRSPWRKAVCERWLAPVPVAAFPAFSSWVIYSDEAREGAPAAATGLVLDREGGTISPIFSLWLTLVAMLGATCLSDYAAASDMHAAASLARRKGER